jgi:hypothetical protein
MSVNRRLPGESHETFKARRASYMWLWRRSTGQVTDEPPPPVEKKSSYAPLVATHMVTTDWVTDEHGNQSRQLRGV